MHPHRLARCTAFCALFLAASSCLAAGSNSRQDAEALVARARALSDLTAKGSPPFDLDATFTLYNLSGGQLSGVYRMIWASPTEFRWELLFPDHISVHVEHAGQAWQTSILPYTPYLIFQLERAVTFPSELETEPKERLGKIKKGEVGGVPEACTSYFVTHPHYRKPKRTFCFDPVSGHVIREVSGQWYSTLELGDYKTIGAKSFPQTLRVLQDGRLIVDVKVTSLIPDDAIAPSLFVPPPGVKPSPATRCESADIVPAHVLGQPEPRYPRYARENRISGTVVIYAEIGKDGVPRGFDVLHSPAEVLSESSLAALAQWRYAPAKCGSSPIATQTSIDVNYSLR